jgi:hypothetical protein
METEHENKTQCNMVKLVLKTRGSITPDEAKDEFGITRLAARMLELKKEAFPFRSMRQSGINRYGKNTRYAVYEYGSNCPECGSWSPYNKCEPCSRMHRE